MDTLVQHSYHALVMMDGRSVIKIAECACKQSKAVGLPHIERRSDLSTADWPISVDHIQAGAESDNNDLFIPLQTTDRQEVFGTGIKFFLIPNAPADN